MNNLSMTTFGGIILGPTWDALLYTMKSHTYLLSELVKHQSWNPAPLPMVLGIYCMIVQYLPFIS